MDTDISATMRAAARRIVTISADALRRPPAPARTGAAVLGADEPPASRPAARDTDAGGASSPASLQPARSSRAWRLRHSPPPTAAVHDVWTSPAWLR